MKLKLSKKFYSRESLQAAAQVLAETTKVYLETGKGHFAVEIEGPWEQAGLFLNEALNHSYRQALIRFGRGLSGALVARSLANGFPEPRPDPLEQLEPQVGIDRREEADALMDDAEGQR
jgi:hypothetical protein